MDKRKNSEWFAMRVDPQTRKKLEQLAQDAGLSQSAAVKLLINSTGSLKPGLDSLNARPQPKRARG